MRTAAGATTSLVLLASAAATVSIVAIYSTRLHVVPSHLGHDEVLLELNARSIAESGRGTDGRGLPLLFSDRALGPFGREPLSIYATAAVVRTLRSDEFAVRFASVLVGFANVALMFLVAARLFRSVNAGIFAALLLAITPVHFFYSRVGVEPIYLVPFLLGWLYCLLDDHPASSGVDVGVCVAALILGLSVYAYKAAHIIAPAYLCLTLAVAGRRFGTGRSPRSTATVAIASVAFVAAIVPYAFVALEHSERYSNFSRAFAAGDPRLSLLQNAHDVLRYNSVGDRLSAYYESFSPRWLFFFADGSWTDSTRQAGIFLAPAAIPLAVGLYAALGPERSPSSLVVAGAFLLAPLPSFVMNEITSRRMIAIAPFGVLLAVQGWRFIVRRPRYGFPFAALLVLATAIHFAVYYRDYIVNYPANSINASELNLAGALQSLAERDLARGGRSQAVVLVENPYIEDYARLYLEKYGDRGLQQRIRYEKLALHQSFPATDTADLAVRQLIPSEPSSHTCPSTEWRLVDTIREPVGNPTFIVCER